MRLRLDGGSFAPSVQYRNWEIHKVFPQFRYFRLSQNPSSPALAELFRGSLSKNEKQIAISFDRQTELVPLSKITYIEAQKQYVVVHTDTQQ